MKKFLVFLSTLFLGACASTTIEKEYVTKTNTIKQKIPDDLLTTIEPKPLINKEEYLSLPPYKREEYLTNYILDLISQLKVCNSQILRIKELNNESKPKD